MKRAFSALLALAMFLGYQPRPITALAQNTGEISGIAVVEGQPLPQITVRLRNVDNGRLLGSQTTNDRGEFRFTGLPAWNYVVESVLRDGTLLGTSGRIALVTGAMVANGVVVSTSAAADDDDAGGAFFAATAGIITIAAAGAGIAAAVVAATGDASPSR